MLRVGKQEAGVGGLRGGSDSRIHLRTYMTPSRFLPNTKFSITTSRLSLQLPAMTDKTIYFTRHAQAAHNVADDYSISDAPLTQLGREQSSRLNPLTASTIQHTAELVVSSPLRRPMQTMLEGYPQLVKRLQDVGKPPLLLTIAQEVNAYPCDTGSEPDNLIADKEFKSLDFSDVHPGWTNKRGIYDPANAGERARQCRAWIRSRPEKEIVFVAHGDILRWITDGYNSAKVGVHLHQACC